MRGWRCCCFALQVALALFLTARKSDAQSTISGNIEETTRPLVVLIHGRDLAYRVSSDLELLWRGSFRDGMSKLGLGRMLRDEDVVFFSYQLNFESDRPAEGKCPAIPLDFDSYVKAKGGLGPIETLLKPQIRPALLSLRDGLFAMGISPSLVISSLKDVEEYREPNSAVACHTNAQLRALLTNSKRPLIVVAHSLGGFVYFRVAKAMSLEGIALDVPRLITLGSQVPSYKILRYMMQADSLSLPESQPESAFPPYAKSWVNFVGLGDFLAYEARKEPKLADDSARIIELHIPTNPLDAHVATAYLKHPLVARAIAVAWCAAITAQERPSECSLNSVADVVDSLTTQRYPRFPSWQSEITLFPVTLFTCKHISHASTIGEPSVVPVIGVYTALLNAGIRMDCASGLTQQAQGEPGDFVSADARGVSLVIGHRRPTLAPYYLIGLGSFRRSLLESVPTTDGGTSLVTLSQRRGVFAHAGFGMRWSPFELRHPASGPVDFPSPVLNIEMNWRVSTRGPLFAGQNRSSFSGAVWASADYLRMLLSLGKAGSR